MADNWIQGAINPAHKGAFTRKANAAGKSIGEYAQEEKHAPGITGRQARLAMTLRKFADGGVVTPQPQQQMPAWQRIWQALMGREALRRASGEQPQAPPPQNTDYSIVRKAAEEAGKRNDEEQRLKKQ